MKKGRIMALIALVFSIAAIAIILFTPYIYYSLDFWDVFKFTGIEFTGLDIIENIDADAESCVMVTFISYIFAGLSFIVAIISLFAPKFMVAELITSSASSVLGFVGATLFASDLNSYVNAGMDNAWGMQSDFNITDIMGYGFWIYFSFSIVLVLTSIIGIVFAFSKKGSAPANAYDQQQYANNQQYANPYQNANSRQYGQAQPQYRNPYQNANNQQYANTQPQTERNTYYAGAQSSDQTVKYRFCTECGSRIPANSRFCLNCGTRVDDVPQQPAPEQNAQPEQPKVMQNEPAPEQNAQPEQPIIEQNAQPEQAQPQTVYNETAQENAETEYSEKDFSDTAFVGSKETFEEPAPVSENPEVHEESTNEQTPEEPKACNTEERRFCMQCGNELKPGDCFCPNCGTKIE